MTREADERFEKAKRLLCQADSINAAQSPEAVIHLSYYAMFHAATAALLNAGEAPILTHGGLIGAFGRAMRDRNDAARAQGRILNRAQELRHQADYGVSLSDLGHAAASLRRDARDFVAFCERLP